MSDTGPLHPPTSVPAWSCAEGWVVFRGILERAPLDVRRASGQPLRSAPGDWWLIGRDGHVARRFQCASWAVDDEIGATAYVVEDGALLEITAQEHVRGGQTVREAAAVAGLRPVAPDDADVARTIAQAARREAFAQARSREAAAQAGRARIAAIPGADGRYAAGGDFDRAQAALLKRLAAFDVPEAGETLRALAAFGAAHLTAPDVWRAPLAWAMEPLVAAGLIVGLDPAGAALARVQWTDGAAPVPVHALDRLDLAALAGALGATEAALRAHAGWADDTDARNTATLLYRAADAVAASRERLRRIGG